MRGDWQQSSPSTFSIHVRTPTIADPLSPAELGRYSRHLSIPEIGRAGQERLKAAGVLVIGAGGLGSPALMYLAAAGVGRIGVVDPDVVDASNLHRQVLYTEADTGLPKARQAAARLSAQNPHVRVDAIQAPFTADNAVELAAPYDVILDGTDNFPTRYLSNDLAVLTGKPNIYGSIQVFEGQVTVFAPRLGGPCYRCMFPEPPPPGTVPTCAEAGVLGVLPGIVGSLQALEALKLILGIGEPLLGKLLLFDALRMSFRTFPLKRDPQCPVCGAEPTITDVRAVDYPAFCGLKQSSATAAETGFPATIQPAELARLLQSGAPLQLVDVREDFEREICALPGALAMPLGQLADTAKSLDPAKPVIVFCKAGMRGEKGAGILRSAGHNGVRNLEGGILAWIREVDPTLTPY